MHNLRFVISVAIVLSSSGCTNWHYDRVNTGDLEGKVVVEWMEPDRFLFRPDTIQPLTFTRSDGEQIRPEAMYTDGGSIPRPFWILRNYSPWGYGPAFIIHDWLFVMQDCQYEGAERWTLKESALVMSEVMKTMMETPGFDFGSKQSVYLMYKAVQSKPAQDAWDKHDCKPLPDVTREDWRPDVRYEISFGE